MSDDRVRLRQLAREVEQLQARREEPVPDADAGRFVRRFRAARARWEWLDHLVIALSRYDRRNGDSYAAALTFQTFTAIVPLLLLAVSIFGFVLRSNTGWAQSIFSRLAAEIPGGASEVLIDAMRAAEQRAGTVGITSLLLFVWLGTGWITNLRITIQTMWGTVPGAVNWLKSKATDLVVLLGLGLAVLISIGLSTLTGNAIAWVLDWLDWNDVPGAGVLVRVVAVAAAIMANTAILQYLMVTLARQRVPRRVALRGAFVGALGMEILKQAGTLGVGRMISSSAAAGVFGAVIVLLVWLNLTCRWLLIIACWTATSRPVLEFQIAAYRSDVSLPEGLLVPSSAAPVVALGRVPGTGDPDGDDEQDAEDRDERPGSELARGD